MDAKIFLRAIEKFSNSRSSKSVLVGFDGFVDNILYAVDKRYDKSSYKRIETIEDFGKRILAAKGKSTNIELVSQKIKMGGNAPLMANPFLNYNISVSFMGAIGKPEIEPVFKDFYQKCSFALSLENPGYTQALEFNDGKIMLGQMNHLFNVNWQNIKENLSEDKIKNLVLNSSLFAFTNWTMLPGLNSIIKGFSEYFTQNPHVFIDLADPQKRTQKDLSEILMLLKEISQKSKIIFGMNKKESEQIAEVLNIDVEDLSERADAIREHLNLDTVLLHSLKFAIVSTKGKSVYLSAPYEPKPLLTTGAGDTLNGGFCSAILYGLLPEEALAVALFTVGYYVRKGYSPNKNQLIEFAKDYFKE